MGSCWQLRLYSYIFIKKKGLSRSLVQCFKHEKRRSLLSTTIHDQPRLLFSTPTKKLTLLFVGGASLTIRKCQKLISAVFALCELLWLFLVGLFSDGAAIFQLFPFRSVCQCQRLCFSVGEGWQILLFVWVGTGNTGFLKLRDCRMSYQRLFALCTAKFEQYVPL